ncbi:MAG: hypothetical protein JWQ34_3637 [Mucilaginibacter sp.]|uniref:hypothetical protein n=1 Tax=Mucilaginibacter sp. TaxID=1882438 RepID=UPI00262441FE|nr:hypothetical protein [Mucilaginibacter sp.]MDB5005412.1 hypothetical protein [Mucilaginibacter sp.]
MKKILIYSLTAMVLMISCRKSDNPKLVGVERVPLPQLTVDATADQVIKSDAPAAFAGKFTVSSYFPDDVKPAKIDIVVIKNGITTNVQTLQANVTTFPATVSVTGAQLQALFGNVVTVLGDSYTIGANITTADGKVFPAFSTIGSQTNPGVAALIGSTPTITYGCLCGFHMTDYGAVGTDVPYKVIADGWQDYALGSSIPVHIIDATHLSFKYNNDANAVPIIIAIDPATNKTSVAKQVYGDYSISGTLTTFSAVSVVGSVDNQVLPCQLRVGVRLAHTAGASSYGSGTITLQKI